MSKEKPNKEIAAKPAAQAPDAKSPVQVKGGQSKQEKRKHTDAKPESAKGDSVKKTGEIKPLPPDYKPRLKKYFNEHIIPSMVKKMGYKNEMQVPRLKKICINQGVHDAVTDKRFIENAVNEITLISGQKPVVTKAKKDISNFKLRKGLPIAVSVTLRGKVMYEFLDRLVSVSLPRIRDFRGINPKSFDGRGNYTLGITEQIIFPEIDMDKVSKINGMDITFVTSAVTDKEAKVLLEEFGMPFRVN